MKELEEAQFLGVLVTPFLPGAADQVAPGVALADAAVLERIGAQPFSDPAGRNFIGVVWSVEAWMPVKL